MKKWAYYNDSDPKVCEWARQLIKAGLVLDGEVDCRPIQEVMPEDVRHFRQVHLFCGVLGWSYALRLAGWEDDAPVWTGSCPCQPFSTAGQRRGEADERHLWPEMRRLIAECHPPVVFGEQVASQDGRGWLAGVRLDLEALGYAVGAADLCAAGTGPQAEGRIVRGGEVAWEPITLGAPHIRQRLFWVADAIGDGVRGGGPGSPATAAGGVQGADGQRQRVRPDAGAMRGVESVGVGDSNGSGSFKGRAAAEAARHGGSAVSDGCAGGVGDTGSERAQGDQRRQGPGGEPIAAGAGFWGDFDIAPCRDGKARRIEPGSFPLAHGIPGRVGLLRGYGNAIVPQVAAEFIGAFMECA